MITLFDLQQKQGMGQKVVYLMKRLDIRLAAQYSGIKAHTIRIWEQRYNLLQPRKGAGNRREYTREDIIILMDIALLTKYGYSISKLSSLPGEKIQDITNQLSSSAAGDDICINKLLRYYLLADFFDFENTINEYSGKKGLPTTVTDLIVPFIERAELFSSEHQSAIFNFAVNILKKKIIVATEQLDRLDSKNETAALFLPSGRHFDLILLYISYHLQHSGFRVIFLGANTTVINISETIARYKIDLLVTYVSHNEKTNVTDLQQFTQLHIADAGNFRNNFMDNAGLVRV